MKIIIEGHKYFAAKVKTFSMALMPWKMWKVT